MFKYRFNKFANNGDYEKSKGIEKFPMESIDESIGREIVNATDDCSRFREKMAMRLMNHICKGLSLPLISVCVKDCPQPRTTDDNGKLKSKTYGKFWHSGSHGIRIEIWNLTATKRKRISNKVFLNTLCHEVNHYVDVAKLGIVSTPHTSGFYMRIGDMEKRLCGE